MLEILDAAAVRRWCQASLESLAQAREEIDAINVYPVADSDTGTNLLLTVEAAANALGESAEADAGTALRAMANGALVGARGNSGVIVSQLLRGLARGFAQESADGAALSRGLSEAADLAYRAVGRPVEGTILTVARAAAHAAEAVDSPSLATVAAEAAGGAEEALKATTSQLEALRRAGVVDAGGCGLCVMLNALVNVVTEISPVRLAVPVVPIRQPSGPAEAEEGPAYEVMYLLEASDADIPGLRERLSGMGESLVVVGGDDLWNVHVHVDDPGPAIETGIAAGRPYRIKITELRGASQRREPAPKRRAIVATAGAPGVADVLRECGAIVVEHAADAPPSAERLLAAIQDAGAGEIVLVADHPDILPLAEAVATTARADGLRAAVIPARSPVQAMAAVAVHEAGRGFDADVIAMSSASGSARHAEVVIATSEAITSAGRCKPGDILGVIDDDVAVIGTDMTAVARAITTRMLDAGGELVTVITGQGAPRDLPARLIEHVRQERPEIDCQVYDGRQEDYPLLVGVE